MALILGADATVPARLALRAVLAATTPSLSELCQGLDRGAGPISPWRAVGCHRRRCGDKQQHNQAHYTPPVWELTDIRGQVPQLSRACHEPMRVQIIVRE